MEHVTEKCQWGRLGLIIFISEKVNLVNAIQIQVIIKGVQWHVNNVQQENFISANIQFTNGTGVDAATNVFRIEESINR